MSPHSDTLSWFLSNQPLLFLHNDACLAEKQQMPILYYLVLEPTIYRTRGEHANHFTIDVVLANCIIFKNYIYYSLNKEKNLLNKKKMTVYTQNVLKHMFTVKYQFAHQNGLNLFPRIPYHYILRGFKCWDMECKLILTVRCSASLTKSVFKNSRKKFLFYFL
jgi:hypothetical protein